MSNIWKYLTDGTLPKDKVEASKIKVKSCHFIIEAGELFKRGFSVPVLKCLSLDQAEYLMNEIHRGICGMHSGARSMATRVIRAGYYWPTMRSDCKMYVQKCKACQEFGNLHQLPATTLHSMQSAWPFAWWEMDILGPFPIAKGQLKFLLVGIDYFTKWIEAEPLAKITVANFPSVLWAYHCTLQTNTQETPYKLTYGSDAMILVEVGEPSHRRLNFDESQNEEQLRLNLDLLDETRECAKVQKEACKIRASRRYNSKLKPRSFHEGDLV
uniref:Gypsy retrotransposon integrase-like protein 1 n=1 Tax=Cajanus cajan TaxID=3821 RepID=A0A151RNZ3_CAJCA|nr:Gypsy retrotransposon integrase-like protein 1 [Cajanus cajan]